MKPPPTPRARPDAPQRPGLPLDDPWWELQRQGHEKALRDGDERLAAFYAWTGCLARKDNEDDRLRD